MALPLPSSQPHDMACTSFAHMNCLARTLNAIGAVPVKCGGIRPDFDTGEMGRCRSTLAVVHAEAAPSGRCKIAHWVGEIKQNRSGAIGPGEALTMPGRLGS